MVQKARGLAHQAPSLFFTETDAPSWFVAAGGLQATCFRSASCSPQQGGFAVGVGFAGDDASLTTHNVHLLGRTDWGHILDEPDQKLPAVHGHYACITWRKGVTQIHTDPLGIRTVYVASIGEGLAFSTRLDWLASLAGCADVDFHTFGAQWLMANQIATHKSPVKGIDRLGPGSRLSIAPDAATHSSVVPWTPSWQPSSQVEFTRALTAFVHPQIPEGRRISLGLSGGLDSRLLLALSTPGAAPFSTHTFGDPEHADVQVASTLAGQLGCIHRTWHEDIPDADASIALVRRTVVQNQAITSASSVLGLRYFSNLHRDGLIVIDGALGEVARRQFLNRLLLRGKRDLQEGNFERLPPYLYHAKPALFDRDAEAVMEAGALEQFRSMWLALPGHRDIGFENKLDLFSVRTRLPNFFGYEQNRLDGAAMAYMPFAQPTVLERIFGLSLSDRRAGKAFRQMIRQYKPILARFPLVKNRLKVSFRLHPFAATAWLKVRTRFHRGPASTSQHAFLGTVKEYALDTLASKEVQEFGAYDRPRVNQAVTSYYAGALEYADFVDWWLSFETWRQQIGRTGS